MLQDPNVERYVENAIKPLQKQITKMKAEIKALKEANKNFVQPVVIKSVCAFKGCKKPSICGDFCGNHCNCRA